MTAAQKPPDEPADEELLKRFHNGDAQAFEVLLQRYRRQIFTYIVRSTRDRGRAEELTQDVFLKVIQKSENFRGESKFSTWLYSITRNLCIDHARRMKHRRHRSLDAPLGNDDGGKQMTLGDRVPGKEVPTDRSAESEGLREKMAEAIAALPEDQREVFLMRQVQNMPFKEIADVIGVSENTIKSRMRYALERLQKSLAEYKENVVELRQ